MSTSSVAARLEARAASSGPARENFTVASQNHAEAAAFLQAFDERRKEIERRLGGVASAKEASVRAGKEAEVAALPGLKDQLAEVTQELVAAQRATAEAAHLLPAYDLRATKLALGGLEESLQRAHELVVPRKRFAFSKKTAPSAQAAAAAAAAAAGSAGAHAAVPVSAAVSEQLPPEDASTGFYRRQGCVLVKPPGAVRGKDVQLMHLTDCVVFILDRPSALRCHNLVGCHIYVGPCSGSVLIYGATDCTFHLAARQLRIHDTHRTTFHLHALSSPIIEHTDTTGFTSYDFSYPALAADMAASGLEGKPSRHATVEDFNWLRSQQSPNWYALLPESNKRAPVQLTPEHVALMQDLSDADAVDEAAQQQLKLLVQELKIASL